MEKRDIRAVIYQVSEIRHLENALAEAREIIRQMEARQNFDDIVYAGEEMLAVVEHARRAAETGAPLLIRGEHGTGKGLLARAIHYSSRRRDSSFCAVSCTYLHEQALERRLFGRNASLFPGTPYGGETGVLAEAHGGTVFLENVDGLSLPLQARLLHKLRGGGGDGSYPRKQGAGWSDVRIIASADTELEQKIERGEFREDLFYQLTALTLFIPPLRCRRSDIPVLARYFAGQAARELGCRVPEFSPGALDLLMSYDWPGNVRELENIIFRVLITMPRTDDIILPGHIPVLGQACLTRQGDFHRLVGEWERHLISEALAENRGNRTLTAKKLGIGKKSLYNKMKKYSLI